MVGLSCHIAPQKRSSQPIYQNQLKGPYLGCIATQSQESQMKNMIGMNLSMRLRKDGTENVCMKYLLKVLESLMNMRQVTNDAT